MHKYIRILKKILRGENVTIVPFSREEWDNQFRRGKWDFLLDAPYNVAIISQMLNKLYMDQGSLRVLDIGCGNGALVRELDASIAYTGTDISEVALLQAQRARTSGTFIQSSMENPSGITGEYDVLVFSEVLLYGDYKTILQKHKPFLKNGGLIIVSLYDTWRTKLIWRSVRQQILPQEQVRVMNRRKKVAWDIILGVYK